VEKMQFDNSKAREALDNRGQMLQAQSLIRSTVKLRDKYHDLVTGKTKRATQYFRDPSRPSAWVRLDMSMVDGAVQHVWTMDDSKIWAHCAKQREVDEKMRKSGIKYESFGAEWFVSTFLLELYLLMRYGIDLRGNEWQDPGSEEGKQLSWIMDRDSFAARYKTTKMMESRNAKDPFRSLH